MIEVTHDTVELIVGDEYYCMVINYGCGGRGTPSQPPCFPRQLRYDGNDDMGRPIFSEKYYEVSSTRCSYDYGNPKWRRYNDENWIVVGILPKYLHADLQAWHTNHYWKTMLSVEPKVLPEE